MSIEMERRMDMLDERNTGPEEKDKETEVEPSKFGGSGSSGLDPNVYATKKTIAQGMLDVALLTANASQLKYLLQLGKDHDFYYLMVTLISLSLILQIAIGCLILIKSRFNLNELSQYKKAVKLNNLILWFIFGVTTINVFISAFGIDPGYSERKLQRASEIDSIGSDTSMASTAIPVPKDTMSSPNPTNSTEN
ncbi:ninjurin-2-like isoform X1 [Brevipalpus obovatus]|uniref:ninjurin-2-like isoform X1 n=1 Tax=Brevipalpus obovatus TaxID=246614 RepID=UPI003D9E80DD